MSSQASADHREKQLDLITAFTDLASKNHKSRTDMAQDGISQRDEPIFPVVSSRCSQLKGVVVLFIMEIGPAEAMATKACATQGDA